MCTDPSALTGFFISLQQPAQQIGAVSSARHFLAVLVFIFALTAAKKRAVQRATMAAAPFTD
ncbi:MULTISPECIES: hypothetical protein [Pantoea]|jgi:hypothetical protein|uniref:hypothetical protein n=1 Tax=Pantoea TaxID=53335 RepID=UPI0002FCB4CC|nr:MULTISPECIES: hypothetical protein [Pantoea]AMB73395.1 hypothetical protein AW734_01035 [Pantoea ananatis]AVG78344.1 hypothetical protein B9Q16_20975 [Pantoea ananatis]MDF7791733.1 hypothetical protein [Pantoea ananatis]MDI3414987.1 hypothetical protein [Pantoea sp. V106_11]MDQ1224375.1 hypothetical protein [Pantoea ananatis]